jgi:hypothetical protein
MEEAPRRTHAGHDVETPAGQHRARRLKRALESDSGAIVISITDTISLDASLARAGPIARLSGHTRRSARRSRRGSIAIATININCATSLSHCTHTRRRIGFAVLFSGRNFTGITGISGAAPRQQSRR